MSRRRSLSDILCGSEREGLAEARDTTAPSGADSARLSRVGTSEPPQLGQHTATDAEGPGEQACRQAKPAGTPTHTAPAAPKANFQKAADVFDAWRDEVRTGESATLYPVGVGGLARIEIGPKLVTLVGGAPGAGKTAFTMQVVVDALRLTPTLRVLVCNVEMTPAVLLDRQLARLSGVDLTTIRYRRFEAEHADRLNTAINTLKPLAERLAFVRPPFDLANVAASADAFRADILLLDYIQRIPPPGEYGDRRGAIDKTMDYLRQFADAGVAVVMVAAVARTKDGKGRSCYQGGGLGLASFRESSELEFGADDAFILVPEDGSDTVTLRHVKARHAEPRDLRLRFDRPCQHFGETEDSRPGKPYPDTGKPQSALTTPWDRTEPASNEEEEDSR